jgi:hypothetical protein
VAHKAIEVALFSKEALTPLDVVDAAIERFHADGEDRRGVGEWWRLASVAERAEVRAQASERVVRFLECFPPLSKAWCPRVEAPVRVELCDGRIVLRARADLVLGLARGPEARVLIVDFKTGGRYPGHVDDLRFYALLTAIRNDVPPFRVASYYLDSSTFHFEDVDVDLLRVALTRTIAGANKMAALHRRRRPPSLTSGHQCRYCMLRSTCEGARRWEHQLIDTS